MGNRGPVKKWIYLILAAAGVLIALSPFFLLENDSCTSRPKQASVRHAAGTRVLLKNLKAALTKAEESTLTVTEEEVNGLFTIMSRAVPLLEGNAEVTSEKARATLSFRIPRMPVLNYINLHLGVLPSDRGLRLQRVRVGKVYIPGPIALHGGRWVADVVCGDRFASLLVHAVQSVHFDKKEATVHVRPIPDLKSRIVRVKRRFDFLRDSVALLGDPLLVREYYATLIEIDQNWPEKKAYSLAPFIASLFDVAQKKGGSPTEQNQAALLALAMFYGDEIIGSFVGPVKTDEMKQYRRKRRRVCLKDRTDLRLHFLISAGLKIMSDRGISHAIGEFKELMDARAGGSGFSFVDLAADRAGVRFAEAATATEAEALHLQQELTGRDPLKEELFFPDIKDLPEGITQAEFERIYRNVESAEYKALVMEIDQCIARLPLYRAISEGDVIDGRGCRIADLVPEELKRVPVASKKTSPKGKTRTEPSFTRKGTSEEHSEPGEMKSGRMGRDVETIAPGKQQRAIRDAKKAEVKKPPEPGAYENAEIRRLERKLESLTPTYTENHPEVAALRRRLEMLRAKAAAGGDSSPVQPLPVSPEQSVEIRRLEKQLSTLRRELTENHPDVVSVQRRLDALRSKAGASTASKE